MSRSGLFLLSCISLIGGILLGSYLEAQIWILMLLAGFLITLVFLHRKDDMDKFIIMAIMAFIGIARMEIGELNAQQGELSGDSMVRSETIIDGVVSSVPRIKNNRQELILENLMDEKNGKPIKGKMIAYAERYPEYGFKDKIKVFGKIQYPENFDGFDYKKYLAAKSIFYVSYYPKVELVKSNANAFEKFAGNARVYIYELVKKIYPQPQAGIMNAMIVGVETDISEETINAFNKTGTRHILAISGFNISIIAVILMQIMLAFGLHRNKAYYLSAIGVFLFVLIIEFSASAVRAAIMGELVLLAVRIGRLSFAGNAVVFAGTMMLLYSPNLLKYDTGFQLSFLAVLGLIYLSGSLSRYFEKYSDYLGLKSIFLMTLSAQIATLPIILANFGSFSLLSVFANLMILPFAEVAMLAGFLTVILGSMSLFLAQIVSWPVWIIISYQIAVIKLFSHYSFLEISWQFDRTSLIIGYYIVLVAALNQKSITMHIKNIVAIFMAEKLPKNV